MWLSFVGRGVPGGLVSERLPSSDGPPAREPADAGLVARPARDAEGPDAPAPDAGSAIPPLALGEACDVQLATAR